MGQCTEPYQTSLRTQFLLSEVRHLTHFPYDTRGYTIWQMLMTLKNNYEYHIIDVIGGIGLI